MKRPSVILTVLAAALLALQLPHAVQAASAPPTDETAATEAWFVDARLDPISNQMRQEAKIVNEDGFSLIVFKHFNGTVWADFTMPNWRKEKLHRRRLPTFVIDRAQTHDLNRLKEFGSSLFQVQQDQIRLQLYASPGQPQSGVLRDIMVGDDLEIRYFDGLGKVHITEFSLIGSDDAIALAMEVKPIGEPSKAKNDDQREQQKEPENTAVAFDRYVDEHMSRCKSLKKQGQQDAYRSCQRAFALCVEKPGQTAIQLKKCFTSKEQPSS